MRKKILRIFSLVVALLLLVSVLPASSQAAGNTEANRILTQIRTIYRQTLRNSGRYSMNGYCGAMVSWQVHLLGITTELEGNDGNTQYNAYAGLDFTSGGFSIRTYSADCYTLEAALNAITYNGTRDVYNVLVGFERTNTPAGRYYGHACMIHAILDGIVYFCESYSTFVNGKFYAEGAPISCSIADFAKYYNDWAVFDGIVYFGEKTYADECTFYNSYLYASVTEDTVMFSAPCDTSLDVGSTPLRTLFAGERVTVTGLFQNTQGEYWYRVDDFRDGYIPADAVEVISFRYDDISIDQVSVPTVVYGGKNFDIKGKLTSAYNQITALRAQVFSYTDESLSHSVSSSIIVDNYHFSLSGTRLSSQLSIKRLSLGDYRYELAAVVSNNYYADGCLQTEWTTVKLLSSDFVVTKQTSQNCTVTFQPNGGSTELNAAGMPIGETLTALPEATRDGYVFAGWFTADDEQVGEDFTVSENTVLYAKWEQLPFANGWNLLDGMWYYYENGRAQIGLRQIGNVTYYFNEDGRMETGLVEEDGLIYFFRENGAMHYGWLELHGDTYFMGDGGWATTGWMELDGVRYCFGQDGVLKVTI